jgi:hypothetical protein
MNISVFLLEFISGAGLAATGRSTPVAGSKPSRPFSGWEMGR